MAIIRVINMSLATTKLKQCLNHGLSLNSAEPHFKPGLK